MPITVKLKITQVGQVPHLPIEARMDCLIIMRPLLAIAHLQCSELRKMLQRLYDWIDTLQNSIDWTIWTDLWILDHASATICAEDSVSVDLSALAILIQTGSASALNHTEPLTMIHHTRCQVPHSCNVLSTILNQFPLCVQSAFCHVQDVGNWSSKKQILSQTVESCDYLFRKEHTCLEGVWSSKSNINFESPGRAGSKSILFHFHDPFLQNLSVFSDDDSNLLERSLQLMLKFRRDGSCMRLSSTNTIRWI